MAGVGGSGEGKTEKQYIFQLYLKYNLKSPEKNPTKFCLIYYHFHYYFYFIKSKIISLTQTIGTNFTTKFHTEELYTISKRSRIIGYICSNWLQHR